ncbi:hypothetical protein BV898_15672 [Hypsibius exemplaris]|uniref:Uncharacterized protein n=1 Tax=Hypsibius exemplaris TaxID=2072580 RepID=A0A9X6ND88_HYPEX|nr:hypothetical protein BV898_15672 [Hypsibius exemplaris]
MSTVAKLALLCFILIGAVSLIDTKGGRFRLRLRPRHRPAPVPAPAAVPAAPAAPAPAALPAAPTAPAPSEVPAVLAATAPAAPFRSHKALRHPHLITYLKAVS